jgi:hypothetical protein
MSQGKQSEDSQIRGQEQQLRRLRELHSRHHTPVIYFCDFSLPSKVTDDSCIILIVETSYAEFDNTRQRVSSQEISTITEEAHER